MTLLDDAPPAAPAACRARRAPLEALVAPAGTRCLWLAASKDPNAKATLLLVPPGADRPTLAAKVPTTDAAAAAVEREGRMLVELRRLRLGELAATIPRFVRVAEHDGRPVVVATALPGTPLVVGYHAWRHTARPQLVERDFALAGGWLARLQELTARTPEPVTLLTGVAERIARRWPAEGTVGAVLDRLTGLDARLATARTPRTAVHGDFWAGNVLVAGGAVTGVVDWEAGCASGEPLRDVARFALAYALYLDRHTRAGRRVVGHPALRAGGWGAGVRYALTGRGWFPALVRRHLSGHLRRLGVDPALWRTVALAGLAEVAADADDATFARHHLDLLHEQLLAGTAP